MQALRAKLEAAKSQGGAGSLGEPSAALAASDTWRQSGFRELEQFVLDFLGGGSSEKLRLKLLTPLNLAAALLDAGGRVLGVQAAAAAAEGAAAAAAEKQLEAFRSGGPALPPTFPLSLPAAFVRSPPLSLLAKHAPRLTAPRLGRCRPQTWSATRRSSGPGSASSSWPRPSAPSPSWCAPASAQPAAS